jgi:hypothetical protein
LEYASAHIQHTLTRHLVSEGISIDPPYLFVVLLQLAAQSIHELLAL